jgi:hypothetical protein
MFKMKCKFICLFLLSSITLLGCCLGQASSEKQLGLKVSPVEDMNASFDTAYEDKASISPSNYYTVSIGKYENVTLTEQVSNVIYNKTAALLSLNCFTKDFKTCDISIQIYDALNRLAYKKDKVDSTTSKLEILYIGEIKIVLINKDKVEKHVSLGLECYHCGKKVTVPSFLSKDNLQEKLDRLEQIKRMIGSMMMLTSNTKRVVAQFAQSSRTYLTQTPKVPSLAYTSGLHWKPWPC